MTTVLWVSAQPDPSSLTAHLRQHATHHLTGKGVEVLESDLYAMAWEPRVSTADHVSPAAGSTVSEWQKEGYHNNLLTADIRAEQDKLRAADLVVLQFPLWWYGMPAILKGWVDRVFVNGFAFGVVDPETGHVRKYGDGGLAGRRALAVVTAGDRPGALSERGISGSIDRLMFPITHGIFHYTGMLPLRTHLIASSHHLGNEDVRTEADRLARRLDAAMDEKPLSFRHLSSGDFDDDMVLHAGLEVDSDLGVTGN